MPFLTGAACIANEDCPVPAFPASVGTCTCDFFYGGFADLYFLPCTTDFSQASITDTDTWQAAVTAEEVGYMGKGLGSMAKKSDVKQRVSSCKTEDIVSITWAIKYQIKCFDLTSTSAVENKINHIVKYKDQLLLVGRMCQDDERIMPVGQFNVSDLNMTIPDNSEEPSVAEVEFSWKEFGIPKTYIVAGLGEIIPKGAVGVAGV